MNNMNRIIDLSVRIISDEQWDEASNCDEAFSPAEHEDNCRSMFNGDEEKISQDMNFKSCNAWDNVCDLIRSKKEDENLSDSESYVLMGLLKKEFDIKWGEYSQSEWKNNEALAMWESFILKQAVDTKEVTNAKYSQRL